jgi:hypothetical protein
MDQFTPVNMKKDKKSRSRKRPSKLNTRISVLEPYTVVFPFTEIYTENELKNFPPVMRSFLPSLKEQYNLGELLSLSIPHINKITPTKTDNLDFNSAFILSEIKNNFKQEVINPEDFED